MISSLVINTGSMHECMSQVFESFTYPSRMCSLDINRVPAWQNAKHIRTIMASLRGCLTLGFLFLVLFSSYGSPSGLARKIISDEILVDSKRQLSEEYSMPDTDAPMLPDDGVWVPESVKEDSKGSLEIPHDHEPSTSREVPHDHGSSTSGKSTSPGDVKVNCGCPACAPADVIPNCPSNCPTPTCGGAPVYYPPQPAPGCHTPPPHTEPLNPQPEPMNPPEPEPLNPQPEPLNPPQPAPVNPAYPCPPYQPSYPPQVNPGCQPASPTQPEPTYPPQVNPGCQPASPPQFNPGCQPATPQPQPTVPPQPEPNYPPQPNFPPQPQPNFPPQPQPTYPPQIEPTNPPQPAFPPQPAPTYPPWHKPSYPPKTKGDIPPPLDGPRGKLGCSLLGGCKSPRGDKQKSLQERDTTENSSMNEVQSESIHEKDEFMNEDSRSSRPSLPSPSMNEVQVESIHKNEDDGSKNEDSWSGPSTPTPPSPRSS